MRLYLPHQLRMNIEQNYLELPKCKNLEELLKQLSEAYPQIAKQVLDKHGELHPFFRISNNAKIVASKHEDLSSYSDLKIFQAIAGG